MTQGNNGLKNLLVRAMVVFLLTRVVVFGAAYAWNYYDPVRSIPAPGEQIWHGDKGEHGFAAEPWRHWDALWFVKTARDGYSYRPGAQSNPSVYPLYPVMIAAGARVGLDSIWVGVLISNLSLFAATVFFLSLAERRVGRGGAGRAAFAMMLFPSAFVLSGVYSESLFLMCVLGAFYFAEQRVWPVAGLFGLAASLTRFVGAIMIVPLAAEFILSKRKDESPARALWLLLVPAGTIAFFIYLHITTGSFTNYFNAQTGWHKTISWPWDGLGWELIPWRWEPYRFFNAGSVLMFSVLAWQVVKKYGWAWGLYVILGLLIPTCASQWIGMPRYVLVLFPAFIALADILKNKWIFRSYTACSCVLMLWCFREFLNWHFSL